ncbi:MAG: hypothetical protein EPN56_11875 [Rhodanobacter sp.]|nr:MAG: hypothetical protein EPN78_02230 [Rhodanobacter sp.]TAM12680.1 MAG: hypothetical protein EPN66_06740 [Rhodanobacter sp.]TAM34872.1 MAG: hypothetical protein EPN56_11875 [Rhodanobacter sp.]
MATIIEFKSNNLRAQLREAMQQQTMVRLWRGELEHGSFCGYIGGVGREFILLWVLGDNLTDDGIYIMRHRDITELEAPERHHAFMAKALALRGVKPRLPQGFPLDSVQDVVHAAGAMLPVIGVHVDTEEEEEVCYIGHLVNSDDEGFYLQELSPDAEWMRQASFFGWDEVSTLSLDDGYAQGLLAVAGPAPALEPGDAGIGHMS